jgi:hypothetical protein
MKYEVEVTRISYSTLTFTVDAANEEEAQELAMDEAYNTVFYNENTADYQIESCIPADKNEEEE